MKKFSYFLVIAITFLFNTNELNAFTTTYLDHYSAQKSDLQSTIFTHESESMSTSPIILPNSTEITTVEASSADVIQNNLTLLYYLCVALVLFNLVAQIKIIYQMIHLFFLFRGKDDFIRV